MWLNNSYSPRKERNTISTAGVGLEDVNFSSYRGFCYIKRVTKTHLNLNLKVSNNNNFILF